jgi:hypothetical protein
MSLCLGSLGVFPRYFRSRGGHRLAAFLRHYVSVSVGFGVTSGGSFESSREIGAGARVERAGRWIYKSGLNRD